MKTRTGYLIKRGRKYYAVWTVAGKKFMQTTGKTTEKEARGRLAEIMEPFLIEDEVKTLQNITAKIQIRRGDYVTAEDRNNPPAAIARTWDEYLSSANRPDSGPETLNQYENHFDQFTAWLKQHHPEAVALRDVTKAIATEYAGHLTERKLSPNRFNKHIRFLELFFRVLKDSARIHENPWEGIKRKRQNANSRRELTVEELRDVCKATSGEMRLLFALGIYTGLRLGDCATLRWGEVDLVRGRITRIPNKTASRNPKPVLVPVHPTLAGMLADTPPPARRGYVMPDTANLYEKDRIALSGKIQGHFIDCKIMTHRPGTGVETVIDENGKEKQMKTGKRAVLEVGFHSLRHTFVSLCRAADTPLSVVEAIVGHSNPAMTRHYTHTGDAAALAAVSALPSVMGDVKALPPVPEVHKVDAGAVRVIVESMTAKTWKQAQAELLKMTAFPGGQVTDVGA
jgi:integrase